MRQATQKPRNIRAEQVQIGDILKVSWTIEDVNYTALGTVTARDRGTNVTYFYTKGGVELFKWERGQAYTPHGNLCKLTLCYRADTNIPLF